MKELLEELKKQYEGNSVMEAVAVSIEKAYKSGILKVLLMMKKQ